MKFKSLLPLIIIFAIIVVLGVVKEVTKHKSNIAEQTGVVSLAPPDVSRLAKIEMYPGTDPSAGLTLACDVNLGRWHVASDLNAPVRSDAIDAYLKAVMGLKGEPRTVAASETDLGEYGLTDKKAFHVVGYKDGSDEPIFHWLIGKSPGGLSVFMRRAGDMQVFVEQNDLRRLAGIYEIPEDGVTKLESSFWVDKVILRIMPDYIMRIALTYPDKSLVFEKVPKEVDASEVADPHAGHNHDGQSQQEQEASADGKKTVYEWQLVSGGPDYPFDYNGLNLLLQDFSPTNSCGFVDPAKKAEWGLENPAFKCNVHVWQRPDVDIEGGRPEIAEGGYMRVLGPQENFVYKCNVIQFETIFRKGSDFFQLPGLTLDKDLVQSIEINQPKGDIVLAKNGNGWTLSKPEGGYLPDAEAVETMLKTLCAWKPVDYADSGIDPGEPTHTVKIKSSNGAVNTITLYKPSPSVPGYYARLNDIPQVMAMSKEDMDTVFLEPSEATDHRVLSGLDESMMVEINATNQSGTCILLKIDDDWKHRQGDMIVTHRTSILDSIVSITANMRADSVAFAGAPIEGDPEVVVLVRTKDGKDAAVCLYPEKDEKHLVTVSGKPLVYTVDHKNVKDYLQVINMVIKPGQPAEQGGDASAEHAEQKMADDLEKALAEQKSGPAETAPNPTDQAGPKQE